jgi:hypothetical protein
MEIAAESLLGTTLLGKALAPADEKRLLDGCADSRSRSLLPAVLLALNTGMRYSELRLLRWQQVDLQRRTIRVGKSKTEAGTGRVIPLNDKATKVLKFWADQFPDRKPEPCTFPSERYGAGGDDFEPTVFDVDPKTPIGSWKEAWESVKRRTGVELWARRSESRPFAARKVGHLRVTGRVAEAEGFGVRWEDAQGGPSTCCPAQGARRRAFPARRGERAGARARHGAQVPQGSEASAKGNGASDPAGLGQGRAAD